MWQVKDDEIIGMTVVEEPLESFIGWAFKDATFRKSKLTPTSDPFTAADEVIDRVRDNQAFKSTWGVHGAHLLECSLYAQALAMCEGGLDEFMASGLGTRFIYKPYEDLVRQCRASRGGFQFTWDDERARFSISRKA